MSRTSDVPKRIKKKKKRSGNSTRDNHYSHPPLLLIHTAPEHAAVDHGPPADPPVVDPMEDTRLEWPLMMMKMIVAGKSFNSTGIQIYKNRDGLQFKSAHCPPTRRIWSVIKSNHRSSQYNEKYNQSEKGPAWQSIFSRTSLVMWVIDCGIYLFNIKKKKTWSHLKNIGRRWCTSIPTLWIDCNGCVRDPFYWNFM